MCWGNISSDHRQLSSERISAFSARTKLSSSSLVNYTHMLLCSKGEQSRYLKWPVVGGPAIDVLSILDGCIHMHKIIACTAHVQIAKTYIMA